MENIKELIDKIVDAVTGNKELLEQFQKNPVKVLEKVLGIDLPDEIANQVIVGVKGKIAADKVSDAVGMLKKLF